MNKSQELLEKFALYCAKYKMIEFHEEEIRKIEDILDELYEYFEEIGLEPFPEFYQDKGEWMVLKDIKNNIILELELTEK